MQNTTVNLLNSTQQLLAELYHLDCPLKVADFLLKNPPTDCTTRESLYLRQLHNGKVGLGLYVSESLEQNLASYPPQAGLNQFNTADYLALLEGVSHFVYVAYCLQIGKDFSGVELELQAEVDKFLILLGFCNFDTRTHLSLMESVFTDFSLNSELSVDLQARYHSANFLASRFCQGLLQNNSSPQKMLSLAQEFYRLDMQGKVAISL